MDEESSMGPQYKVRRKILSVAVLLIVDLLWVGSSELTRLIFKQEEFRRPFFTTYMKTSMFVVYLLGFLCHRPWRERCLQPPSVGYARLSQSDEEHPADPGPMLSDPQFELVQYSSDIEAEVEDLAAVEDIQPPVESPDQDLEASGKSKKKSGRQIRFNTLKEVRHLPESEAELAKLSRVSFDSWLKAERLAAQVRNKMPIRSVAKMALQFCLLWFMGNFAYQAALNQTDAGIVNVLSSTSSLFTLVIAALYPSNAGDKFSLSKFCAVLLSMGGVAVITYVDENSFERGIPKGAIWALIGSFCYAAYLVLFRRRVPNENRIDISMFLGFVGLFNLALMWPGFYVLHVTGLEPFYPLPNGTQLLYVTLNGLVGTVLSDYLWLWGCFLTSSLIATLSLALTIPLTIAADAILWKESYPVAFLLGTLPVVAAFIIATGLSYYDNYDPVYSGLQRLCGSVCDLVSYPYRRYCSRRGTGVWPKIRIPSKRYRGADKLIGGSDEDTEALVLMEDPMVN